MRPIAELLITGFFLLIVWSPVVFLVVMAWRWAVEMLRLTRSVRTSLAKIAAALEQEEQRR
jgi:hypothetical protein